MTEALQTKPYPHIGSDPKIADGKPYSTGQGLFLNQMRPRSTDQNVNISPSSRK